MSLREIPHYIYICIYIKTILFYDCYLRQEEVGVFLFRCPFHKLTEWQRPVNKEQLRNLLRTGVDLCVCLCESSPVRKVFVKKVHLWHSGHVDLHFLVSTFLSKIFSGPLFQAGTERHPSQHGWSALEK